MKTFYLSALLLLLASNSYASGSQANRNVQEAMKTYVNEITSQNGSLPLVYKGKVLNLTLYKTKKYPDGLHSGVKKQGDLYASCADFVDKDGRKYDVDFLVSKTQNGFKVVQPIVHSVDGKKNKYDLEH